jgi:murein DD-endopeptidase MepM/ murein hydrolase activator NlpD
MWSCHRNSSGQGIHTGADIAAPTGTVVVAARPGKVVHCNHGSAFGNHQIEVLPGDGTRDFYAHLSQRVKDGTVVKAGDRIGNIGAEGNVTGPHLHFERHTVAYGGWSCDVITNPKPSLDYETESDDMPDYANTKPISIGLVAGEWVTLKFGPGDSPLPASDDPAGLRLGGATWQAVLALTVTAEAGSTIHVRTLERLNGETVETHPINEQLASSGSTFLQDSRIQSAREGARVRWQVKASNGGKVTDGKLNVLAWSR